MEKKLERVAGPKGNEPSIKTKRRYIAYQESVGWQRLLRKNLLYNNLFGVGYFIPTNLEQIGSM
jgi:hypothetical protein